jgi:hypothetical protein
VKYNECKIVLFEDYYEPRLMRYRSTLEEFLESFISTDLKNLNFFIISNQILLIP